LAARGGFGKAWWLWEWLGRRLLGHIYKGESQGTWRGSRIIRFNTDTGVTLFISKAFASYSETATPQSVDGTAKYDPQTSDITPDQIRLASNSPFDIEDIFIYAYGKAQINFLDSTLFDSNISKLGKYYSNPYENIETQQHILSSLGNGSIDFPSGTPPELITTALLRSYPGYEARFVYFDKSVGGKLAYIYFRRPGTKGPQSPETYAGTAKKADVFALTGTPEFGAGTADRITNFNPKEKDKLQIDISDFGSNAAGTFGVAKNAKAFTKALASTTDFIYLKSTGELYYNENGGLPGYGDGGVFAILANKANITTKNVEFL